jgi:hypothetical protein
MSNNEKPQEKAPEVDAMEIEEDEATKQQRLEKEAIAG